MDSTILLVVDQSPECAEEINSLLRNSGINVHVNFAATVADIRSAIDTKPPFLIIYNEAAASDVPR